MEMRSSYYRQVPVMISQIEAAELLGLSQTKVSRMVAVGELAGVKVGARVLIVRTEIDRLIAEALEQQAVRRAAEAQLAEARATLKALPRRRTRRAAGL